MSSLVPNPEVDARRSIERWENEGGRVRVGSAIPSHLNRPSNVRHSRSDPGSGSREASPTVGQDAPANSLLGSHVEGRVKKTTNCAAVLLGPPGSGKTTLVRSLAAVNPISVVETGNLL